MVAIRVAPEREKKVYRLRCAFTVPVDARGRLLELAVQQAGERFFIDMTKQGFAPYDGRLQIDGPFPHVEVQDLPALAELKRMDNRQVGRYLQDMRKPTGLVDYKLVGLFLRNEMPIDTKGD